MALFNIFKWINIFSLTAFLASLFITSPFTIQTILADSTYTTDAPAGYCEPTDMAKRVGIIYTSTGIVKQLQNGYFVTLGETVKLSGDGYPGRGNSLNYEWWKASEDEGWQKISGRKSSSKNYKFKAKNAGTYWFQLRMNYVTGHGHKAETKYIYTQVAKVVVTPNRIKAESITLDTDSDYIYNKSNYFTDNSAYVFAEISPERSTEQVKWSLKDSGKDLAVIDDDGKISANVLPKQIHKTGEIEVYATSNTELPDAPIVQATKKITVGGGLFDVHATSGNSATFEIQGIRDNVKLDTSKVTVTWERKKRDESEFKDITDDNASSNKFVYKIPDVSFENEGDLYQATIKATIDKKPHSYTTNPAELIIDPTEDHNIYLQANIENLNFTDHEDTALNLNNVAAQDEVSYNLRITNFSKSLIPHSEINLLLHKDTSDDAITVDNQDLDYQVNSEATYKKLIVQVGSLDTKETKTIKLKVRTPLIKERQSFAFQPTYISFFKDRDIHLTTGSEIKLNYITNRVELHPQDINFEPIYSFERNVLKHRLSASADIPLTIDDQRRDKSKSFKLSLTQISNFTNQNDDILPIDLLFYKADNTFQDIKTKTQIAESDPEHPLEAIHWDHDHGLLLHLAHHNNLAAGNYKSQLSWNVEDSI